METKARIDRLGVFLIYYREYRTMENIAIDYDVANSTNSLILFKTSKKHKLTPNQKKAQLCY